MQTNFAPERLRDPEIAEVNSILRNCVHCGLCTATCPTFVTLGDELDSPRGRIYLIKDMLENDRPATGDVARHVDRCLSCLSCMTTCPSGVHYMHLVDHARAHIERTFPRPFNDRALRWLLGNVLTRPGRFRLALLAAALAKPFAGLLPMSSTLGRRLRAMLRLAPARLPAPSAWDRPGTHAARGERRMRVALLAGCAQPVLAPGINEATIRLLTRMGVEVVLPQGAGCCGSLAHHIGQRGNAMGFARANVEAWSREIAQGGLDAIVVNASGCGTTIKDYGFMFREDPLAAQAAEVSKRAVDISELLTRLGYAPTRRAEGVTIAYHAACSLQHGQKIVAEPKALLRAAGFRIVEPRDPHLCCGSAGTYNILEPEIAARLRARKLETLKAVRPDAIAAGNIGCLTQLAGEGVPTVHSVALLDWAMGGPVPDGMESLLPG